MNDEIEFLGGEMFKCFCEYVSHKFISPEMIGGPTKHDGLTFFAGVSAGLMVTGVSPEIIGAANKVAIEKVVNKFPSVK